MWNYLIMVNEGGQTKFYTNNTQILQITQTLSYSESGSFEHYIGYTSESYQGVMWSFYLYDTAVNPSDFFSSSYTPGNCLVDICPSSCKPALKENNQDYCMLEAMEYSCNSCLYGCKNGICLDCSSCSSKSCSLDSNIIKCVCPGFILTPLTCTCPSNQYYSATTLSCKNC